MAVPIATLAALGIETVILTNAAGSLRAEVGPGSPMLITDHIALGPNPLVGEAGDGRFVSMVDAYDPRLATLAREAAVEVGVELPEGVYMWFSGPSFRDAGRDPDGADAGGRRGRHVDRAGNDPRPSGEPAGRRDLDDHQPRRRHDRPAAVACRDQGGSGGGRRT